MTQYAPELLRTRARRSVRAIAVLSLAPLTMLAGVVFAFIAVAIVRDLEETEE